jgi:hypothetical protein
MTPIQGPLADLVVRIEQQLLPTYCRARSYSIDGFKPHSVEKVTAEDARNFLRALDAQLAEFLPDGRYRLPQSRATEVLFWEGWKSKTPRSITLSLEPLITLASIARLHLDFGWPKQCLGTQPRTWAFDLSASLPSALESEHIVGEVKKSAAELDALLRDMNYFCATSPSAQPAKGDPRRNAFKKWQRLRDTDSSYFWAIGPGANDHLFEVLRSSRHEISLQKIPVDMLRFRSGA